MKISRNFFARDHDEQATLLKNSCCPVCAQADIGLTDPFEYEENGRVFVEGKCAKCRSAIRNEITMTIAPDSGVGT